MTDHDRVYQDGRIAVPYVFLANVASLKPGDIVLTRDVYSEDQKAVALSLAIRSRAKSNFSHALICTVPPTLMEAIGGGVSNLSLGRCFVFDIENVRILRYPDQRLASAAGSAALNNLGRKYSLRKAWHATSPDPRSDREDDGTFCSGFVCSAFVNAGAPEFQNLDWLQATPATLEGLPFWLDVTDEVFHFDQTPRNAEDMVALDGQRSGSPAGGQAAIMLSYWDALRPEFKALQQICPEIPMPEAFFQAFESVINGLKALKPNRETLNDQGRDVICQLEAIDARILGLFAEGALQRLLEDVRVVEDADLARMKNELGSAAPDINALQLSQAVTASQKQLMQRQRSLKYFESLPPDTSDALKWWIPYAREQIRISLKGLRVRRRILKRLGAERTS